MTFNLQKAREHYSDDEILDFLSEQNKFDKEGALKAGYSKEDILESLSKRGKPKEAEEEVKFPGQDLIRTAGRTAMQYGLSAAEMATLPYEIGVSSLKSEEAQLIPYREELMSDLEYLLEKKQVVGLDEQEERHLAEVQDQIANPEKSMQYVQTIDPSIRGIVEEITGIDTHPEGVLEKSANILGAIKKPTEILREVAKSTSSLKSSLREGAKLLIPGRTLGAAAAWQMAENNDLGPMGTMTAIAAGDIAGGAFKAGTINLSKFLSNPKKYLAEKAAKITPKETLELQKEVIQSMRESGIQADIGTLTNSPLIKSLQSRIASSGFVGKELHNFKKELFEEVKNQYKNLAEKVGESVLETRYEASELGKNILTGIRDAEKTRIGEIYNSARQSIGRDAVTIPDRTRGQIDLLLQDLIPGSLKSAEQQATVNALQKLRSDLVNNKGISQPVPIQNLMNSKIALNDIINYEVQGGQKKLLRNVIEAIDKDLMDYGVLNKNFLKNYSKANQEFSKNAKIFRNKTLDPILTAQNPEVLMNKMNTVQGMKDLEKALSITPEGKEYFNNLKRLKLSEMVDKKAIDGATNQMKFGTFANLGKNPKDKQLLKEILGSENFKIFERLQKNSGDIADTYNAFANYSGTAGAAVDYAIAAKAIKDVYSIVSGNPWPMVKSLGAFVGGKKIANLMADREFLTLVEDAILARKAGDVTKMLSLGDRIAEIAKPLYTSFESEDSHQ